MIYNSVPRSMVVIYTDQEVPGTIFSPVVGFSSSGQLFHAIYGMDVSMFQCSFFIFPPVMLMDVIEYSQYPLE